MVVLAKLKLKDCTETRYIKDALLLPISGDNLKFKQETPGDFFNRVVSIC